MSTSAESAVIKFAQAFEKTLGTEKTIKLVENLANFAETCPETIIELEELVLENPQVFGDLLTPIGVKEAKEMIGQVSSYIPLMNAFAG